MFERSPMRQLAEPSEVHLNNAQSNAERCNEVDLRAAMAVFTTADGFTVNVRQRA